MCHQHKCGQKHEVDLLIAVDQLQQQPAVRVQAAAHTGTPLTATL
jgi:hypothetical protein